MHFVHEHRTVTTFVRIIAGEFRGRRLLPPADLATRPITDRVKQSLFDILSQRLPGATVFDVFAGTGSLGLEALSRGASQCVFFELHRPAAVRLRKNIEALGLGDRCRIVTRDVLALGDADLQPLARPALVFFDPPYPLVRDRPAEVARAAMVFARRMSADGRLMLRVEKGGAFAPDLPVTDGRAWGSMRVLFLAPPARTDID